jgi:lipid-A-disaccharide synthase
MPVLMKFADQMHSIKEYSEYQFVVAGAPSRSMDDYSKYFDGRQYIHVVFGESYAIMRHSEAAVINSGTASLECALIGTPQVVAYGGAEVNFLIAKSIIKVKYISLGNLILNRTCFKELMQYYFNADTVTWEVRRMIEDKEYRNEMLSGYAEIREALGGKGASNAVAKAMIEELK